MAAVRFSALANSTVVVTAIVYGLLLTLAGAAGWFGLMLRVMITVSMYRYGYAALRQIANGWNHFPPPDLESTNPFGDLLLVFHATLRSRTACRRISACSRRWPASGPRSRCSSRRVPRCARIAPSSVSSRGSTTRRSATGASARRSGARRSIAPTRPSEAA